jgi:hypothetical protein
MCYNLGICTLVSGAAKSSSTPTLQTPQKRSNDSKSDANDARNIAWTMRSKFTDTSNWVFRAEGSGAAALFDTTWIWILVRTIWD